MLAFWFFLFFATVDSRAARNCNDALKGARSGLAVAPARSIAITELLRFYREQTAAGGFKPRDARRLVFRRTAGRDVYNPTAVFDTHFRGKPARVLLGRTEVTLLETGTESIFYQERKRRWRALPGAPIFQLQDPFFSRIGNDLVVGGVETFEKPGGGLGYRTVFHRDGGQGIDHLIRFSEGPNGMKDIRLLTLEDGEILVLTRPQGEVGGRGKIGVTTVGRLEDLSAQRIQVAPLLEGQFAEGEWGGANAAYLLADGKVGVLGHIAKFDAKGKREYYPVAFTYDPKKKTASPLKILLERADLPGGLLGKSKRPDLKNVLFSGGLVRHGDGTATLYVGAGDAEVYRVTIADPFH